MKQYLTLFRKEIKNMYRELLLVLMLQIVNMLVILNIGSPVFRFSQLETFINKIFDISFFFYPALLVYSLYLEERTGTIYQMHSFPIKRVLLGIKLLVVFCATVLIFCVISVIVFLGFTMNIIHGGNPVLARQVILGLYYTTFISLCLVCTAWGVMQLVRQNRLVVGLATGIVGYGFYIWLTSVVKKFGVSYIDSSGFYTLPYNVVFTFITGGIFCLIGFFFYERYSEI